MKTFLFLVSMAMASSLNADELPEFNLTIKDAKFSPPSFTVDAGKKFKLIIKNEGPGAEEFESNDLNREKIIPVGKSITVFLGPLSSGTYKFFGEYHPESAQGILVVK